MTASVDSVENDYSRRISRNEKGLRVIILAERMKSRLAGSVWCIFLRTNEVTPPIIYGILGYTVKFQVEFQLSVFAAWSTFLLNLNIAAVPRHRNI